MIHQAESENLNWLQFGRFAMVKDAFVSVEPEVLQRTMKGYQIYRLP